MTETSSTIANRTLPRRLPNSAYRVREYLTEREVDRLIETARKRGRNGQRDVAAILLAYRHGLRAQELCSLRWSQIDLRHGRLHVNRAKGGQDGLWAVHANTSRWPHSRLGESLAERDLSFWPPPLCAKELHYGLGETTRKNLEFALLARRGNAPAHGQGRVRGPTCFAGRSPVGGFTDQEQTTARWLK